MSHSCHTETAGNTEQNGHAQSASACGQSVASIGYPIFVDLANKSVVVIGGGKVAQRKIETLLPFNPRITLVSPKATETLAALAREGRFTWLQRPYQKGDLTGAVIAFSACGIPEVDQQIFEEADELNVLLNVVDVPSHCTFTVPSTMARGPLRIAVSTSGCAPTEAKRIRRILETQFDESWEPYLNLMQDVRVLVKERVPGPDSLRKPIFEAAAKAGWRERLAAGEQISAEDAYQEALKGAEVNA